MTRGDKLGYGVLVLAALVFLWVIRSERQVGEDQAIITKARAALAQGKAFRLRLAKIQQVAQAQADSARRWKAVAANRSATVTRLETGLAQSLTQRDSLDTLLVLRDTLTAQVILWQTVARRWELAYRADSTRASNLETRLAILETHLAATLTVADCHLGNIRWLPRCPSRNTAAVVGIGVGVLGALVLK